MRIARTHRAARPRGPKASGVSADHEGGGDDEIRLWRGCRHAKEVTGRTAFVCLVAFFRVIALASRVS